MEHSKEPMEHYRDPRRNKIDNPSLLGKKTKFNHFRERNEKDQSKLLLFNFIV